MRREQMKREQWIDLFEGSNGKILAYNNRIVINRGDVLGAQTIPMWEIVSVQVKRARIGRPGYIRFVLQGEEQHYNPAYDPKEDDFAVTFSGVWRDDSEYAIMFKEVVDGIIYRDDACGY